MFRVRRNRGLQRGKRAWVDGCGYLQRRRKFLLCAQHRLRGARLLLGRQAGHQDVFRQHRNRKHYFLLNRSGRARCLHCFQGCRPGSVQQQRRRRALQRAKRPGPERQRQVPLALIELPIARTRPFREGRRGRSSSPHKHSDDSQGSERSLKAPLHDPRSRSILASKIETVPFPHGVGI